MIRLYGLSTQGDHIGEVLTWLQNNGITVEHWYTDTEPSAQEILTQNNLTIQPVLFEINTQGELIKFAEGDGIMQMNADQINAVKAAISATPVWTPPAE